MPSPKPLLQVTRELLAARLAEGSTLRQIVEESNGAVEYQWLRKFADESVADPGVNRVQGLHDSLIKPRKSKAA